MTKGPGGHHTEGTGFEGHGFFEASSIRKINGKYYFVYSSHKSHELCYAISDRPDMGFVYGGTIGNNHGRIEKIGEDYYIFYHRQQPATMFRKVFRLKGQPVKARLCSTCHGGYELYLNWQD